jgi:flagellar basal body-associated protein FliL
MEEKTNFFEKFWYLFVILAVILVGIVAGLWFYNQKSLSRLAQTSAPAEEIIPTVTEETDTQTTALESQSASDEITYIEADLQSTDLSNLDREMLDIEAEINNP